MNYIEQLKKRIDSDNKAIKMYENLGFSEALNIVKRSRKRKINILKDEYNILYA